MYGKEKEKDSPDAKTWVTETLRERVFFVSTKHASSTCRIVLRVDKSWRVDVLEDQAFVIARE